MAAKMPKAPKPPKAPKAPKADSDKAKKAAGKEGKKWVKRLLKILIPLLILAIIGLIVYFVFFAGGGPGPGGAVQKAIDAAFIEDADKFKEHFTEDSREALESAWGGADIGTGATRGSWNKMMRGLLTPDELKPEIIEESVSEDGESGQVVIDQGGVKRTIYLVLDENEEWKIDVNMGIDPTLVRLPEEMMTEEIAEEFAMGDPESEMWWEERESESAKEKAEAEGGCCTTVARDSDRPAPLAPLFAAGLIVLGIGARRRSASPPARECERSERR